ncbi:unnamed protein product [Paramecium octaurelia]|uniref:WD domain, G-beta repeat protein n=1 Tax=Paramecium octaurelia TaxID=43137 RepID=A0A8S1XUR0_PAROT|nr:unnamed protein product [Paramecium octaurelia]
MNSQQIVAQLQYQVEECLVDIQQQIDSSFSRIDAFLDQVIVVPQLSVAHKNVNYVLPAVQLQPFIQTLANSIIQEVKPIINLTIHQQIEQNQLQLTQLQTKQIQQQDQQKHSITNNLNPFTYYLLYNNSIQQNEYCYAIAINKDNTIVLAGCNRQIKVFEFKQEQLKQTQLLNEHQNFIITLNFMKKQNQFISGDVGGLIITWSMNQNSQWIFQQQLKEHSKCINCLVINNNEDLMISGSEDNKIKFWQKQNQWLCSQTITDHTDQLLAISLNDEQNRVITSGRDKLILIIQRTSQDSKWNVIQKISVEEFGRRLCFINDNVFAFQPNCQEQMDVYEMSSTNKQYSKTKQIAVICSQSCQYWFPLQYIKQKCLLVNKNGQYVNLIRKNQNADFITQQTIDFGHDYLFGQMSEDGNYLITWDYKSKQIQIRNYQQK